MAKNAVTASQFSKASQLLSDSSDSLESVQVAVEATFERYESNRNSRVASWLHRLSRRIHYYGRVLDVMVQHHPEYVSLAWGMMKLLFMISIEHENHVVGIAKALTEISDLLPDIDITAQLYASPRIRTALANLYASIMQLFIRTQNWCEKGRFSSIKRIAQSVVTPFELQYSDFMESIRYHSDVIKQIGATNSLVDVRNIKATAEETYRKVNHLSAELASIKDMISLNSTALSNTNNRLSDLQFSQILMSLSRDLNDTICDPSKTVRYLTSLKRRQNFDKLPSSFFSSLKLRQWTATPNSEVCLIMGNVPSRVALTFFCLDVIQQLRGADVPCLLALKINHLKDIAPDCVSNIDILKYLVKQALQHTKGFQTQGSMALNCTVVSCARSEAEWLDLLGMVLSAFNKQVYMIIDLGILVRRLESSELELSWLTALKQLLEKLSLHQPTLCVKVMLITSSSSLPFKLSSADYSQHCIPVRAEVITVRLRKKCHY
ncbi:hypothetical protein FPHYL_2625 [Fusarium phyllophilum]|uniref:DUF7708 domain-containing protein n=1 Tax=Fusarium phyllophilum TaxID=47803 RepID=A0A8H5KA93_9HYPO|nr:hypothetical protein FPHYL_2625 [Fusarium phyllophilum]